MIIKVDVKVAGDDKLTLLAKVTQIL